MIFILGPCVIENFELLDKIAKVINSLQKKYPQSTFIFKASFDKANRTSLKSFRGPGLELGLYYLKLIKDKYNLLITTDVHESCQIEKVSNVVDIIQIPAFLCRQTDLLVEAGKTKKIVNIKKGQFMAPWDMEYAYEKAKVSGAKEVWITERGYIFGYNNLVVDFRSFLIMKKFADKVIFDATHSVQLPGGGKGKSSGQREFVYPLALSASLHVDGIFAEVHPEPEKALSDGPNMLHLKDLENFVEDIINLSNFKFNLNYFKGESKS